MAQTFGQRGRGVPFHNAQSHFQRGDGRVTIVAGFAERLVRIAGKLNRTEQRADAAAVVGFGLLAAVLLTLEFDLPGHVFGTVGFDGIENNFHDLPGTLIPAVFQIVFEIQRGGRRNGLRCKGHSATAGGLHPGLADGLYLGHDFLDVEQIPGNRAYQTSGNEL